MARVLVLLAVCLAVAWAGDMPSNMDTCMNSDDNLEHFVLNYIDRLRPNLMKGIPELGVPALEPLRIKLPISIGVLAVGHDVLVHGAGGFKINKINLDLESHVYFFGIEIPELFFIPAYVIDRLGAGHGPLNCSAKHVSVDVKLSATTDTSSGMDFFFFDSVEVRLKVTDLTVRVKNLLDPSLNKEINAQAQELLASILPKLQRHLADAIFDVANKIAMNISKNKHITKH